MSIKSFKLFNGNNKINESRETDNYMFFDNIKTIKRLVGRISEMDESEIDKILINHDWASDHISVAKENVEQVFNFLYKDEK